MFPREVMLTYLTEMEARLTEESHEVDMDDLSLGSSAISDLTSLKQVADLLRVENLGIA
jgi:hypothetical protein